MEGIIITPEFIEENKGKTFLVEFIEPTYIHMRGRGKVRDKIKVRFFISTCGTMAYFTGNSRRNGLRLDFNGNIKKMTEVTKKVKTLKDKAQTILNRLDDRCWPDIKEKLTSIVNGTYNNEGRKYEEDYLTTCRFRSLREFIPKWEQEYVLNGLKKSFENGTEFSWYRRANSSKGRDYSIQTCTSKEDGKFRAWFSSEYSGCGNGDYYLIINPTTAMFYETD